MKKTQVTAQEVAEKGIDVIVTYVGRSLSKSHFYILEEKDKEPVEISFVRKLQRFHRIGYSYPAKKIGNSFTTKRSDYAINDHKLPFPKKKLVEYIKDDEAVDKRIKREANQTKLAKIGKDAAKSIKRYYQLGSDYDKATILRAFVEEIEAL